MSKLLGLSKTLGSYNRQGKASLDLLGSCSQKRGLHDAGADRDHTNTIGSEITSHGKGHAGNGTLAGTVSGLTLLAIKSSNRASVDNHATKSVRIRLVLGHLSSGILGSVEGSVEIHLEHKVEDARIVHAALLVNRGGCTSHTSAVHDAVDAAKFGSGSLNSRFDRVLVGGIHLEEHAARSKLLGDSLATFLIAVKNGNISSLRSQAAQRSLTETGSSTSHEKSLTLAVLHFILCFVKNRRQRIACCAALQGSPLRWSQ
mmetsp:Transcript_5103/g.8403  ORF Transcript_5103/g.8403 Transcript_5103/m.8403 type:complete len:259 (-) Transcript_5103:14-790(-)